MKKCFIIHVLKKGRELKFLQSVNAVFETRELAKEYINACDRKKYVYYVQEVDYFTE